MNDETPDVPDKAENQTTVEDDVEKDVEKDVEEGVEAKPGGSRID